MTTELINALNAKFTADKLKAFANLTNYINNPAGIGEHPDIVSECYKLVQQLSDAAGYLATLQSMIQEQPAE